MIANLLLKASLLTLALAALGGCASQPDRTRAGQATAGASAPASNAALDRFFVEEDRAQIGR
jgi:hypothetical protein